MTDKTEFTSQQMKFLEIFHVAAQYDCLYILDFYCMNEFNHDRVTHLSDDEREILADLARHDIFSHAFDQGYQPAHLAVQPQTSRYLC